MRSGSRRESARHRRATASAIIAPSNEAPSSTSRSTRRSPTRRRRCSTSIGRGARGVRPGAGPNRHATDSSRRGSSASRARSRREASRRRRASSPLRARVHAVPHRPSPRAAPLTVAASNYQCFSTRLRMSRSAVTTIATTIRTSIPTTAPQASPARNVMLHPPRAASQASRATPAPASRSSLRSARDCHFPNGIERLRQPHSNRQPVAVSTRSGSERP